MKKAAFSSLALIALSMTTAFANESREEIKHATCEIQLIRVNERVENPSALIASLKSNGYKLETNNVLLNQPESSRTPELFVGQTYDLYDDAGSTSEGLKINLIAYDPEKISVGSALLSITAKTRGISFVTIQGQNVDYEKDVTKWGALNTQKKRSDAIVKLVSSLPKCTSK